MLNICVYVTADIQPRFWYWTK